MSIKTFKPTTPSRRHMTVSGFDGIDKHAKPEASLTEVLKKHAGRNSYGHITVRHRGGGEKRKYRIIDFKRDKVDMEATVLRLEYDPIRSANSALVQYADGEKVLRAKIDMANPNMHFRDPIIYRIITSHPHHRTGRQWNVYPMYDFAHGQSDYFEGVTHSICTLEFVVHRPLYDYYIDQFITGDYRPRQYEFNRLNITYTVMSKRKMLQLVKEGLVAGWDDPRMPTAVSYTHLTLPTICSV